MNRQMKLISCRLMLNKLPNKVFFISSFVSKENRPKENFHDEISMFLYTKPNNHNMRCHAGV